MLCTCSNNMLYLSKVCCCKAQLTIEHMYQKIEVIIFLRFLKVLLKLQKNG